MSFVNEPTAAAVAYGLKKMVNGEYNVLIFDVSLLTVEEGWLKRRPPPATPIWEEDFDTHLVNHGEQEFKQKSKNNISSNAHALRRLYTSCERAKRTLSFPTQTISAIDSLFEGLNLYTSITHAACASAAPPTDEETQNLLKVLQACSPALFTVRPNLAKCLVFAIQGTSRQLIAHKHRI